MEAPWFWIQLDSRPASVDSIVDNTTTSKKEQAKGASVGRVHGELRESDKPKATDRDSTDLPDQDSSLALVFPLARRHGKDAFRACFRESSWCPLA